MNVEQLREYALSLPHTTEDIKWESDLCFCIGGKMFCVTGLAQVPFGVSFKVTESQYQELIERIGIIPAPYLARYKWVYIQNENVLSQEEWKRYIQCSYEMVKRKLPKKALQKME